MIERDRIERDQIERDQVVEASAEASAEASTSPASPSSASAEGSSPASPSSLGDGDGLELAGVAGDELVGDGGGAGGDGLELDSGGGGLELAGARPASPGSVSAEASMSPASPLGFLLSSVPGGELALSRAVPLNISGWPRERVGGVGVEGDSPALPSSASASTSPAAPTLAGVCALCHGNGGVCHYPGDSGRVPPHAVGQQGRLCDVCRMGALQPCRQCGGTGRGPGASTTAAPAYRTPRRRDRINDYLNAIANRLGEPPRERPVSFTKPPRACALCRGLRGVCSGVPGSYTLMTSMHPRVVGQPGERCPSCARELELCPKCRASGIVLPFDVEIYWRGLLISLFEDQVIAADDHAHGINANGLLSMAERGLGWSQTAAGQSLSYRRAAWILADRANVAHLQPSHVDEHCYPLPDPLAAALLDARGIPSIQPSLPSEPFFLSLMRDVRGRVITLWTSGDGGDGVWTAYDNEGMFEQTGLVTS